MKLIVTGALGHIGSKFIHSIRPGDHREVILLDNLLTQHYCSLLDLPQGVPFRFINADICTANLETLFKDADVVIHFAAITDVASSFENAEQVEQVNYEGTERVERACSKYGSRMIFFSTTSIYGTQEKLVNENCSEDELKPQSPYASSKLKAEHMLQSLGNADGLKFAICRFGTILSISIGMRFHTAINKFCWQACEGQPITVWRTVLYQRRAYLDLKDRLIKTRDYFENVLKHYLFKKATYEERAYCS